MSKRKPKKPIFPDGVLLTLRFASADSWPVICPACGGEPFEQICPELLPEGASFSPYRILAEKQGEMMMTVIQCARCDGRGTVIGRALLK